MAKGKIGRQFALLLKEERERIEHGFIDHNSPFSISDGLDHHRNRYSNVTPYNFNRVRLPVMDTETNDDYINASHIEVTYGQSSGRYIATQGPTPNTITEFWQMCYNEVKGNNIVVVNLTPLVEQGVRKCHVYWPRNMHESLKIPTSNGVYKSEFNLQVKELKSENGFNITVMDMVSETLPTKKCYHIWTSNWADCSTPSLEDELHHISKTASHLKDPNDPLITHCSAGVGRTGTFITFDFMLNHKQALVECDDPVWEIVKQLREQRMMMVQTYAQYDFLKHAWSDILNESS
ncbi:Phosphotyrosine-specific protein phosphatase [Komagataella phaffii CBS 7435]|uniref:Phosphotyrosine-specific protein phosphatase n=2 Tax=Komagataella phaffii TaxID=460519 RepID=C4R5E2_KOMPG|nr:Phosphotyrosine-specific protein phosphatase [Komagataella phaffii GS115]CAH2449440.1 Phosphotyrosine-specific protein phosphatase [Komagataella phaffii CBS 7435]CAY70778.1 Phosphotyrosine-specific protein phosphatase [Komagataella phaffii GS115]CCA39427.1 Phosphotyrosine-specific protein phosphatase [Komagataella phaffii CBS 7435]